MLFLCVIKVTTDDLSSWLPTKCKAESSMWSTPGSFVVTSGGTTCEGIHHFHIEQHRALDFPLLFLQSYPQASSTVGINLLVHPTHCGADGWSNSSNALSFQKAVGESLQLMAPPWADHHPSLPLPVARRPSAERRPTWDPFGEHICQMTACSVYHPLWLRQIHCHWEPLTLA